MYEYGRLPFFDKYIEKQWSFSNVVLPIKKVFALLCGPFKRVQIGLGKMFFSVTKAVYKTEISSYAFEASLDFVCRKQLRIPIVCGDLHFKITDTLRVFNDYLDLYNIATLLHYQIIDDRFVKASTRTALGDTLANVMQMRLFPHMTAMNVYRNDLLCCVINELKGREYKKVLLISQAMRLRDLYDKLCGKATVNEWIKSMDDTHVLMNKMNAFQYNLGKTNVENTHLCSARGDKSEFEEEVMKCIGYLGYRQTAFMLLEYPLMKEQTNIDMNSNDLQLSEKEFVEKLHTKIEEMSQELKLKYS